MVERLRPQILHGLRYVLPLPSAAPLPGTQYAIFPRTRLFGGNELKEQE